MNRNITYGPRTEFDDAIGELWENLKLPQAYSGLSDSLATLKELYSDDADIMKNLVYSKHPFLKMIKGDQ